VLLDRIRGALAGWPQFAIRAGVPRLESERIAAFQPQWVH
jgi:hypothetical protein